MNQEHNPYSGWNESIHRPSSMEAIKYPYKILPATKNVPKKKKGWSRGSRFSNHRGKKNTNKNNKKMEPAVRKEGRRNKKSSRMSPRCICSSETKALAHRPTQKHEIKAAVANIYIYIYIYIYRM